LQCRIRSLFSKNIVTSSSMGIYTFLYTDIEGSTHLWESQPEAMRQALEKHDTILRSSIETQQGRVFRTAGDAFCAVFLSPSEAVAAAVTAQKSLNREPWELEAPMRVRIVIHTTEAEESGGDFISPGLNRIGRLLSVCNGGQILLSQATQAILGGRLPAGSGLIDLGSHRLRDLTSAEHIYQVSGEGILESFPALKTIDAVPNNLPVQLTDIIGREHELEELRRAIDSGRLITLTGPGGVGKSRLAIQSAAELMPDYPDGVWLVELAPISEAENILPVIASVLKIRELPNLSLQITIIDLLHNLKTLMILDNCEHLIEACAEIAGELLQACPELRIISSSREPMGISGESTLRIPSLSFPTRDAPLDEKDLQRYEAMRLFEERARSIQRDFKLGSSNVSAVAQICRRLDGIPLAIELAAARIKVFSPQEIADNLDNRFRLLTGGSRTALPRQQTLHALINWSYELLSLEEKTCFTKLSVFAGGWTLEAAAYICELDRIDMLDKMESLVNKSLVISEEEDWNDTRRFHYLETIRVFAADRLLDAGAAEEIRSKHLQFFSRFAEAADQGLMGHDQRNWILRLDREQENFRRALDWSLQEDPDAALKMAGCLGSFWSRKGYVTEGLRWLHLGMDKVNALPELPGDSAKTRQGILARALLEEGRIYNVMGRLPEAIEVLEKSVLAYRMLDETESLSYTLAYAGLVHGLIGDSETARKQAEEALEIGQKYPDSLGPELATTVLSMQSVYISQDYERVEKDTLERIKRFQNNGNEWFAANTLFGLGMTLMLKGDLTRARERFLESQSIYRQIGDRVLVNVIRSALAEISHLENDYPDAIREYLVTMKEWRFLENYGGLARCLEVLAFIRRAQASSQSRDQLKSLFFYQAAVLLGAAASIRRESQSLMTQDETHEFELELASIKTELGNNFESPWIEGQAMSIDQAIAFADQIESKSSL
jgi:predicted ATPase/class 3 adenylate cyclase